MLRIQNKLQFCNLLILSVAIIIFCAKDSMSFEYTVPDPKNSNHLTVAQVGLNRVDFSQVYEIWGPVWRDVIIGCNSKKITSQKADERLQKAWEDALDTAIREEIFSQEAQRDIDKQINEYAKKAFESQKGASAYMVDNPTYKGIHAKIKARYYDMLESNLQNAIEHQIKRAGSRENLYKILERQGVTWEDWKKMIRRKIKINIYLEGAVPMSRISQSRPAEVRDYYNQNIDKFKEPDTMVFRHIFISFKKSGGEEKAKEKAAGVYAQVQQKKITFEYAVKKYSDDKVSVEAGGLEPLPAEYSTADAFTVERDSWLKEVKNAVSGLEEKGLGPLLISEKGCHLVYLVEKKAGAVTPFSVAQSEITVLLRNQKREILIQKLYDGLRSSVMVKILMPDYPEKFSWTSIVADNPKNPLDVINPEPKGAGPEL